MLEETFDDVQASADDPPADVVPGAGGDQPPEPSRVSHPQPGDPPAAVRGANQTLSDPPGNAADDGTPRWDPRTQTAEQREGG